MLQVQSGSGPVLLQKLKFKILDKHLEFITTIFISSDTGSKIKFKLAVEKTVLNSDRSADNTSFYFDCLAIDNKSGRTKFKTGW
jgi:hypothetical protein